MKYFGDNSLTKLIALIKDTLSAHTDDTSIHVTAAEKEAWDGAATVDDVLSEIRSHNRDEDAHKDIREEIAALPGKPQATLVTLSAASWDAGAKTQTVDVAGIDADESKQMICVMPYSADAQAYKDAGIQMSAQAAGKATFICSSVPGGAIKVWVVVEDVEDVTPPSPCLTFSSPSAFSIYVSSPHWDGTMEYSTDNSTWNTWTGSRISGAANNDGYVLYIRGTGNTVIGKIDAYRSTRWDLTGSDIACNGNIEALLDYATVAAGEHPAMGEDCYSSMFYGCTSLTTAPDLPATTLTYGCYEGMFYGCTSLTAAPALPATVLATCCYQNMFNKCTGLTTAPELPATTLASYCYRYMFNRCASLTTAPALPATTLADSCYNSMFNGCTSLKLSTAQTGNYTKAYRIPTSGTGTTASNALSGMFGETGGTFTGDPEINTTYYLDESNSIV